MKISRSLQREIDRKKAILVSNPDYFLSRQKRVDKQLHDIRSINSWLIEHPQVRDSMLGSHFSPQSSTIDLLKKGVENLEAAWHYLVSTSSYLTPEALKRTGALVDPGRNGLGYRDVRVSLGMNHVPPNPLKVPMLVDSTLEKATDNGLHPVEVAAVLHLELAGIQPFVDGNKRTSRLYQDRVLYGANLPVAFIPVGERAIYLDLLEQGWEGLRDDKLELQEPFVNYIGGKVNVSLDQMIGDINKHRSRIRR